jgi:hypothetical protein
MVSNKEKQKQAAATAAATNPPRQPQPPQWPPWQSPWEYQYQMPRPPPSFPGGPGPQQWTPMRAEGRSGFLYQLWPHREFTHQPGLGFNHAPSTNSSYIKLDISTLPIHKLFCYPTYCPSCSGVSSHLSWTASHTGPARSFSIMYSMFTMPGHSIARFSPPPLARPSDRSGQSYFPDINAEHVTSASFQPNNPLWSKEFGRPPSPSRRYLRWPTSSQSSNR